jgi:hypothetical protein
MSDKPQSGPCSAPEHRQFDFWIGAWDVFDPSGTRVGRNTISAVLDGCALHEQWQGVSGLRGTSLNTYAAGRGQWHQTWVDSAGSLLLLDGGIRDGAMVLEGRTPPRENGTPAVRHRITWSVVNGDPDRVRQHWETSPDGTAWQTAFDGLYVRVPD